MTQRDLLLNGRYRLADQIAAGGMGEVWKGADELLGRQVAVKLLHHQYATDPTFRARFRAEAQYTARLTHPGIAQVYDYGEQDDVSFLVMELVPGEPLSEILARHRRLTPDVTLDIIGQAARALQSAHSVGLMHRDIKPGNLLVTPDGSVKLTDFGIARAAEAVTLTQTGMVMGTAHYVSPEQAAGKALTPATDIYSLGVVAYECLAGRPPFTAETVVTVALKHVRDSPPPLPDDVPGPVQELVAFTLEKDPASRPGRADELADRAHVVRETLTLGPTHPVTGRSTLPNLLATGPDDAGLTGPQTDPRAQTPDTAPAAVAPSDPGATQPHTAVRASSEPPFDTGDDTPYGEYGVPPRRRRRGPVVALTAVVVLVSALVVGALLRSDGSGDDQRARQIQSTATPGSGGLVPADDTATPNPAPSGTFAEPPPGGVPGGSIIPQPTQSERPPPDDDEPEQSPTLSTPSPSAPSSPEQPTSSLDSQESNG